MRLFEPERHEKLTEIAWDEQAARAAIVRIAADTEAAYRDGAYWAIHPLDVSDERPDALKPLYNGAAGIIWALAHLAREGAIDATREYLPAVERLVAADEHDHANNSVLAGYAGPDRTSFLQSAFGMRALEWRLAPSDERSRRMGEDVRQKRGDARGLVWGAAGQMLGAQHLYELTKRAHWRDAFVEQAETLLARLEICDPVGTSMWRAELYGDEAVRVGALHGFFANAYVLLRGRALLPAARQARVDAIVFEAFARSALVADGLANWPYTVEGLGAGSAQPRYVQFCVGAPGVVAAMAQFPNDAADKLLRAGGELIWRSGPPTKMPSLCHGAPGSGYAFLKLFARTGDAVWLERARAFAMHAIAQSERALTQYGQRKFSLLTGDLGLAAFLWACVRADARMPLLDVF